ncbi:glycosyltransferase family 4 protein [Sphingomonas bacterium]|uniref:glycosyltransferase family 4 protein n=1 Tax=Sphingomonas bacterium TaxID=1895847 RepID=UPI0020C63B49|nr:glycosyltransferase family 1 protein [Sphingomonas bacterium]
MLARLLRTTPTGVDRVELSYAQTLLKLVPERLVFGARFPKGLYGRLDPAAVKRFIDHTAELWKAPKRITRRQLRPIAARHLFALRPRRIPPRQGRRVFLQTSPHQIERTQRMARILAGEDAKFVTMVHDLIPITNPEYVRPESDAAHRQRIATIKLLADGVIANSAATRDALVAHVGRERALLVAIAHLGTDLHGPVVPMPSEQPYFVCVATIEARKNHLLLLNIWRRMVEEQGKGAPMLHLIGKRGWENEQVVDMLERCRSLQDHVVEHHDLDDRAMRAIVAGARALVLPSFEEGFGMPVAEALAAGTPVIAADIAALREVGRQVPDYLDPLDGLGWRAAVEDYGQADSPRRAAQMARLKGWRPCTWEHHMAIVLELIDSL